MPRLRAILGAVLSLAAADAVQACDSTGCYLATRAGGALVGKGRVRVDLSFRHSDQRALREGGGPAEVVWRPRLDFEGGRVLADYHRERGGEEQFWQAEVAYGVSSRVDVFASLPLTRRTYDMTHGFFDHVYATDGFGDVAVGGRVALDRAARWVGGLALKLPSGTNRLTSFFDGGIHDPSLQPGSGAVDVLVSLQTFHGGAPWSWSASGSYQRTSTNDLGYRWGDEAIAAVSGGRSLTRRLRATLQAKLFHRGRSTFQDEGVRSTGQSIVYLSPGFTFSAPTALSPYAVFQIPVYRYVNEMQLAPRGALLMGLSRTF